MVLKYPMNIAFAGFNNDAVSRMIVPKLTTIDYPGYEVGKVCRNLFDKPVKGRYIYKNHQPDCVALLSFSEGFFHTGLIVYQR